MLAGGDGVAEARRYHPRRALLIYQNTIGSSLLEDATLQAFLVGGPVQIVAVLSCLWSGAQEFSVELGMAALVELDSR